MPQRPLADLWRYLTDVEVVVSPEPAPHEQLLVDWLSQPERELNTEATRVVVAQLCDAGHRVAMRYREVGDPSVRSTPDACDEPSLSEPTSLLPVRLYETDFPHTPQNERPLEAPR